METKETNPEKKMVYRFLGNTGLKVSVLSFGTMMTTDNQETVDNLILCIRAAWDHGINFFDTAEIYSN